MSEDLQAILAIFGLPIMFFVIFAVTFMSWYIIERRKEFKNQNKKGETK